MYNYTVYTCIYCGRSSTNKDEIRACETQCEKLYEEKKACQHKNTTFMLANRVEVVEICNDCNTGARSDDANIIETYYLGDRLTKNGIEEKILRVLFDSIKLYKKELKEEQEKWK